MEGVRAHRWSWEGQTALGSGPSGPPRRGALARSAGALTRRAARRRRLPALETIVSSSDPERLLLSQKQCLDEILTK
jgi:hypothetical protein